MAANEALQIAWQTDDTLGTKKERLKCSCSCSCTGLEEPATQLQLSKRVELLLSVYLPTLHLSLSLQLPLRVLAKQVWLHFYHKANNTSESETVRERDSRTDCRLSRSDCHPTLPTVRPAMRPLYVCRPSDCPTRCLSVSPSVCLSVCSVNIHI